MMHGASVTEYRTEMAEIYTALKELGTDTTRTYVRLRAFSLLTGYAILILGCTAVGTLCVKELRPQ